MYTYIHACMHTLHYMTLHYTTLHYIHYIPYICIYIYYNIPITILDSSKRRRPWPKRFRVLAQRHEHGLTPRPHGDGMEYHGED